MLAPAPVSQGFPWLPATGRGTDINRAVLRVATLTGRTRPSDRTPDVGGARFAATLDSHARSHSLIGVRALLARESGGDDRSAVKQRLPGHDGCSPCMASSVDHRAEAHSRLRPRRPRGGARCPW